MDMYREEYEAKRQYLSEWTAGVLALEITDNTWMNALVIAHNYELLEATQLFDHVYYGK